MLVDGRLMIALWVWLEIKQEGQTAGVGPCFPLTRVPFYVGTGFLSHSLMALSQTTR